MKPRICTLVLLAATAAVPLLPSAASAEVPTCRGREATHVGTPGELLITTPGRDVVVSNGARAVRTLNGNDVICATRGENVTITPGGGDDLVDASRVGDAGYVTTYLGVRGVAGSSGDDTYVGNGSGELVRIESGSAGDRKRVTTGGGEDYLHVGTDYDGDVAASLGRGKDHSNLYQRAGIEVDAGRGRDELAAYCTGCDTARFDLRRATVLLDGAPAGKAAGYEVLEFDRSDLDLARRVTVIGNDAANRIVAYACRGEVRGGPGDDDLYWFAHRSRCNGLGSELTGGPGDDYLYATDGPDSLNGLAGDDEMVGSGGNDALRGGEGQDFARGGQGDDLCRAETSRRCER